MTLQTKLRIYFQATYINLFTQSYRRENEREKGKEKDTFTTLVLYLSTYVSIEA